MWYCCLFETKLFKEADKSQFISILPKSCKYFEALWFFGTWILSIRTSDSIRYFFFLNNKTNCWRVFFVVLSGIFWNIFFFCNSERRHSIEYLVTTTGFWTLSLRDAFHFSLLLFLLSFPFPSFRLFVVFLCLRHFGVFIPLLVIGQNSELLTDSCNLFFVLWTFTV